MNDSRSVASSTPVSSATQPCSSAHSELVPRRVALVEPDVAPLVRRDAVPEPHVRRARAASSGSRRPRRSRGTRGCRRATASGSRARSRAPCSRRTSRTRRTDSAPTRVLHPVELGQLLGASFGRRSAVRLGGVRSRTRIPSWTPRGGPVVVRRPRAGSARSPSAGAGGDAVAAARARPAARPGRRCRPRSSPAGRRSGSVKLTPCRAGGRWRAGTRGWSPAGPRSRLPSG